MESLIFINLLKEFINIMVYLQHQRLKLFCTRLQKHDKNLTRKQYTDIAALIDTCIKQYHSYKTECFETEKIEQLQQSDCDATGDEGDDDVTSLRVQMHCSQAFMICSSYGST